MILDIVQIAAAIILIIIVLMQNQGAGLGAAFGGEGNVFRTKRGFEKTLFIFTIIISIIFLATALANVIL
ncbi:preprotein translocase subunit SecG [Candidatus Parcubacteria bacterium]|nr:MAG: preprotein translocase subunit SecG [Candidatus Parcubacteria bacterium]